MGRAGGPARPGVLRRRGAAGLPLEAGVAVRMLADDTVAVKAACLVAPTEGIRHVE